MVYCLKENEFHLIYAKMCSLAQHALAECMRLQLGSAHYTPCRLQHVCSVEAAGVNSTLVWNVCSSPMGVSALRSAAIAENGVAGIPVLSDTNG